jgi:hypothetical protein
MAGSRQLGLGRDVRLYGLRGQLCGRSARLVAKVNGYRMPGHSGSVSHAVRGPRHPAEVPGRPALPRTHRVSSLTVERHDGRSDNDLLSRGQFGNCLHGQLDVCACIQLASEHLELQRQPFQIDVVQREGRLLQVGSRRF